MRVGIVGSGNIVVTCLNAISQIAEITCEAIVVRESSRAKGEALAKEFGINKIYTDYQALLNDPEIDIVYIGIPNNLHYEYALAALNAHKHVVCEKPFTSNSGELLTLSDIARKNNLFLLEAITLLYSPNFQYIKENLVKVGDIKLVQCNYSQYSSRYPQYLSGTVLPAFDPAMSGGALYDINIYNVHFICGLFGKPDAVEYHANIGFNGIDTSGILIMQYPAFIAVCSGAKDSQSPSHATVQGINGYIKLTSAPNISKSVECCINNELSVINKHEYDNHMVNEFRAFHAMFTGNDYSACYKNLDHSLVVLDVLTQARKKAGIYFNADDDSNR